MRTTKKGSSTLGRRSNFQGFRELGIASALIVAAVSSSSCGKTGEVAGNRPLDERTRVLYLAVEDGLFSLQACREAGLRRGTAEAAETFGSLKRLLSERFGEDALKQLELKSRERFETMMIRQCGGEEGLSLVQEKLRELDRAISETPGASRI